MWTAARAGLAAAGLFLAAAAGAPAEGPEGPSCASDVFEDVPYTYCLADPARDDIRLWHADPDGQVLGTFDRLAAALEREGRVLAFAMNGGMYHDDRAPVGLYVEEGAETAPIVTSAGPGNFGMLPNGVFCLAPDGRASVTESRRFDAERPACRFASQSGPLMVEGGRLHPRFLPDSTSRHVRNAVGVRPDGTVVLAITDRVVTFHRFARLMRDALGTPDALYIDGKVSRLYAPELGRHDIGFPLGPIVGVTLPAPAD